MSEAIELLKDIQATYVPACAIGGPHFLDPEKQQIRLGQALTELEKLQAENKLLKKALEEIRDLETKVCSRCEGNGRLYADGKRHYMSEYAPTILCGTCGGSGRILPEDAQEIAEQALKNKGGGRTDKGLDTESD